MLHKYDVPNAEKNKSWNLLCDAFPGWTELAPDQQYRVVLNSFSLKEITREEAIDILELINPQDS